MILIILFAGILLFVFGALLLPTKALRIGGGTLGCLTLLGAALLMIGNDNWHWGMVQVTTTKTTKIASVSPSRQLDLLVYQPLKHSSTERVYAYRLPASSQQHHTAADLKTTNRVSPQNTATPTLVTKTTSWRYRSGIWRWLFSDTGKHHEVIKTENTFVLPRSWETLSVRQSKWLAQAADDQVRSAKHTLAGTVAQIVAEQRLANPSLTDDQLQAIKQRATRTATTQAQQQLPQLKAKLIAQAKAQPVE